MGAKFTIVLDTDDLNGLRDALEVALLLNKKHNSHTGDYTKAELGKIALIKFVREAVKHTEQGKLDSSLRSTKRFVDERWLDLTHK